jgi:hypothetical protein
MKTVTTDHLREVRAAHEPPCISLHEPRRPRNGLLTLFLGAAVLGFGSNVARGDWWGWGFGGFNFASPTTDFLNQRALIHASNATGGPVSNNVYAGNSNAYFNRIRDNGFVPSYDVARRVPPSQRRSRATSPGERPGGQAPPQTVSTASRPVIPFANFFDAAMRLTWPSDAPVTGDLRQKRDISDEGCLVVLGELQTRGSASIASVADSRQKLLDYGQPALQEIRTYATPPVADTFHRFLLALYESLAQTANPPETPPADSR